MIFKGFEVLKRRLFRLFLKTDSVNTPPNGTCTAGGRDIVDFRIERPYVEICWSCFLHCARMIYAKNSELRRAPMVRLHCYATDSRER